MEGKTRSWGPFLKEAKMSWKWRICFRVYCGNATVSCTAWHLRAKKVVIQKINFKNAIYNFNSGPHSTYKIMRTCLTDNFYRFTTPIICLALLVFYVSEANEIKDDVIMDKTSFDNEKSIDWADTLDELNKMLSDQEDCQVSQYKCTSRLYNKRLCDCNDDCMKYGGCCIDNAALERNRGIVPDEKKYVCGSIHNIKRERGVVMIGNCHPNFIGNQQIEEFCFRNPKYNNIAYAYLIDIPAISMKTNLTYVNFYCAFCNADADELFPMSQFNIVCHKNIEQNNKNIKEVLKELISEKRYDLHRRIWTSRENGKGVTCYLENIEYEDQVKINKLTEKQYCQYTINIQEATDSIKYISRCNSSWTNEKDFQKCRMYSAKFSAGEYLRLYKNPHCALCNFVNISSSRTHCEGFPLNAIRWSGSVTYTIKIDSSRRTKCRYEHIWDPIQEKCFAIPSKLMLFMWTMSNNAYKPFLPSFCGNLQFIVTLISELCLFLHIFLFVRNKFHRRYETILLCLCCCLFIANLLIFAKMAVTGKTKLWIPVVLLLQYFWSVSFFWMNVISIDIFITFSNRTRIVSVNKDRNMLAYSTYAWGAPFILVLLILVIVHLIYPQEDGETSRVVPTFLVPTEYLDVNSHVGWLANAVLFLIPITIIVLVNFVLLIITSIRICQQARETRVLYLKTKTMEQRNIDISNKVEKTKKRRNYVRPNLYIKLGLLQGCTWMLWIIACCINDPILLTISHVVNGLQGAYILISFDFQHMASCLAPFWQKISTFFTSIWRSIQITELQPITKPLIRHLYIYM